MNGLNLGALKTHLTFPHKEIRDSALLDIQLLQKWLIKDEKQWMPYGIDGPDLARIAPSLVTRGDCELFGVAFPRFAYRAYLNKNKSIFVNIRRLPALTHQVGEMNPGWSSFAEHDTCPFTAAPKELVDVEMTPAAALLDSSFIADSLVSRSDLDPRTFNVLTCTLAADMGEDLESHGRSSTAGTPFSLGLGLAGLCGSNVCFMVGALMQKWASSVSAVAEIAAVAGRECPHCHFLPLNEVKPKQIGQFFRDGIGLNASFQISSDHYSVNKHRKSEKVNKHPQSKYLKQCIRPYVMSGFPVILQVSSRRMADIYQIQNIPDQATSAFCAEKDDQDHVIAIVGCAQDKASDVFIF